MSSYLGARVSPSLVRKPSARSSHFAVRCEAAGAEKQQKAKVKLNVKFHTDFGQSLCVAGATEELGKWQEDSCVLMDWNEGDLWSAECELPKGTPVEYKYVIKNNNGEVLQWQPGSNSVLEVPELDESIVKVEDCWIGGDRKIQIGDEQLEVDSPSIAAEPVVEEQCVGSRKAAEGALLNVQEVDIGQPQGVDAELAAESVFSETNGKDAVEKESQTVAEVDANLNGSEPFAERL